MDDMTAQRFDVVVAGGLLIDGTGRPPRRADIGIIGDRVRAIGELSSCEALERIDVRGKAVAPGFIDAHTHDDTALLDTPEMAMKVSQGVTTVIAGNCGISIAPAHLRRDPPPPLDLIGTRQDYRFATMGAYFDALERRPAAVNAVMLVGHASLRASVMDDLERRASDGELVQMKQMLDGAMRQGAIGLSTGLAYAPARAAPAEEIVRLGEVVHRHGGLYATHMRDEADHILDSIKETLATARSARVPVVFSHHKCVGKANHGLSETTLRLLAEAMDEQPLAIDVYPYAASSTVLKEDRVRQSTRVLITWSLAMPEAGGRELAQVARDLGCSEAEAIDRLQPAGAIYFALDEGDVRRIIAWPGAMIGSDGLPRDIYPHPRLWGTFPRVLGHYSRDVGLLALEEAVRKMTALPAEVFGLKDRGTIAEGALADLVVFDHRRIIDCATFADPKQQSRGIERVYVNGRLTWVKGAPTGERGGRVLRRDKLDKPMRARCNAMGWTV